MVQPNDGLALRSGQEDDYRRDSIERDEKRLAELGRKTVEMFVISHIITEKMEVRAPWCWGGVVASRRDLLGRCLFILVGTAVLCMNAFPGGFGPVCGPRRAVAAAQISYRDAEALKRQDLLIAEEFELQQNEESKAKAQAEKDKEKKAKKKVRGRGIRVECAQEGRCAAAGAPLGAQKHGSL